MLMLGILRCVIIIERSATDTVGVFVPQKLRMLLPAKEVSAIK